VPIEGTLKAAIERAVRDAMPNWMVRKVEIFSGEDHDGDPVLFVDVDHELIREPVDPKQLSFLVVKLRDEFFRTGETRFPIVRHHFAENQKVVGYK
jgi:hypothetical protein